MTFGIRKHRNWKIEEGLPKQVGASVFAKIQRDPPLPHYTGAAWHGIPVLLLTRNPLEAQLCGKWLLKQGEPVRPSNVKLALPKIQLGLVCFEYGRGTLMGLMTTDAERIEQFVHWIFAKLGGQKPGQKPGVIKTRFD